MPGRRKAWKTENRFPTFPRAARDDERGSPPPPNNQRKETSPGRTWPLWRGPVFRLIDHWKPRPLSGSSCVGNKIRVQAHSWIGKCRSYCGAKNWESWKGDRGGAVRSRPPKPSADTAGSFRCTLNSRCVIFEPGPSRVASQRNPYAYHKNFNPVFCGSYAACRAA